MPARYETLAGWANECGWTKGVELGVFDGTTLLYLLEHCPALTMTGVDVWDMPVKGGATVSGERCYCEYCSETRERRGRLKTWQRETRVRIASRNSRRCDILKMPTAVAAGSFTDGSLDFVFVDGDHSREGVASDIAAWRSKIRPDGRVIGHDWNMESVRQGVLDHFGEGSVRLEDDHLWWVNIG